MVIRMPRLCPLTVANLALALSLSAAEAWGQVAAGTLVDDATKRPIPTTFVLLLNREGVEIARSLTDSSGQFALMAAGPGTYRLRAEQIGRTFTSSDEVPIGPQGRRGISYPARSEAVPLSQLPAAVPEVCDIDENAMAHLAWREVAKALRATMWTGARAGLSYRVRVFERAVGLDRLTVHRQRDSLIPETLEIPFASDARAAELGFVRQADSGWVYHATGPADLLHSSFPGSHCFGVRHDVETGTVGITFRPRDNVIVGPSDLAGTAWLDARSGWLRAIDYHYPGDPSRSDIEQPAGGRLTFRHIGSGLTILAEWNLVMPTMTTPDSLGRRTPVGFEEIGAAVLYAGPRESDTPLYVNDAVTTVRGTVFDSTQNAPLAHAVVALPGTNLWSVTDDDGSYFIAGYLDGVYRVVFGSGRLDSLGFVSHGQEVVLTSGSAVTRDLHVPSLAGILADRCGGWMPDPRRRVLVGVVRSETDGSPVSGAVINVRRDILPGDLERFTREQFNSDGVSDSLGTFALCDVPVGETIIVSAIARDRASAFIPVRFGEDNVSFGDGPSEALNVPVARLDLALMDRERWSARVGGTVTVVNSREGLEGATVMIDGTAFATRTDSLGRFMLEGVPGGRVQLLIRRFGFKPLRHEMDLEPGTLMTLSAGALGMEPGGDDVTVLDPISVEAEAVAPRSSGFEERRATGIGSFATRQQIDDWNSVLPTDVLRHMRGIRVVPNAYYGVGGDTRRYIIASSRDPGPRVTQLIRTDIERQPGAASASPGLVQVAECPVLLFIDGVYIGDSRMTDIDNIMSATNLAAVEVYSSSQVPARFSLPGATCGAVVMWTLGR